MGNKPNCLSDHTGVLRLNLLIKQLHSSLTEMCSVYQTTTHKLCVWVEGLSEPVCRTEWQPFHWRCGKFPLSALFQKTGSNPLYQAVKHAPALWLVFIGAVKHYSGAQGLLIWLLLMWRQLSLATKQFCEVGVGARLHSGEPTNCGKQNSICSSLRFKVHC